MKSVRLPLWTLAQVSQQQSEIPLCEWQDAILAFSAPKKASVFMRCHISVEWHIRLIVNVSDLLLLLADLRDSNVIGICLDPMQDGAGGTYYTLEEFVNAVVA